MSEIDTNSIIEAFKTFRGGRFTINRFIAAGGMGSVFQAYDTVLERTVAVKLLHPSLLEKTQFTRRFKLEARIMTKIDHPCIARVHDLDELDGIPMIMLEWIVGGSLWDYVQRKGGLDPATAVHQMIQICTGVEAAHEQGIIHRDIKPENILMGPGGVPKVTDFGIAVIEVDEATSRLTKAGMAMGTPGFLAPEQLRDAKEVDVRADVHALGVTLWSLLKNQMPPYGFFFGLVVIENPETLQGIPGSLLEIIKRATQVKRDHRYETVAQFREALEQISGELGDRQPVIIQTMAPIRHPNLLTGPSTPVARPVNQPSVSSSAPVILDRSAVESAPKLSVEKESSSLHASLVPNSDSVLSGSVLSLPQVPRGEETLLRLSPEFQSATQFGLEMAATRKRAKWRVIAISILVLCAVGAGGVYIGQLERESTSSPSAVSAAVSATQPVAASLSSSTSSNTEAVSVVPVSELAPVSDRVALPTMVQSKPRRDITQVSSRPRREQIELDMLPSVDNVATSEFPLKTGSATTTKPKLSHQTVEKFGSQDSSAPTSQGKISTKSVKPPGESNKPENETRPSNPPASALPQADKSRVTISFADGEKIQVWLMGHGKQISLFPASVPPGTYKVVADFSTGKRTAIASLTIQPGVSVRIMCNSTFARCRAK